MKFIFTCYNYYWKIEQLDESVNESIKFQDRFEQNVFASRFSILFHQEIDVGQVSSLPPGCLQSPAKMLFSRELGVVAALYRNGYTGFSSIHVN